MHYVIVDISQGSVLVKKEFSIEDHIAGAIILEIDTEAETGRIIKSRYGYHE